MEKPILFTRPVVTTLIAAGLIGLGLRQASLYNFLLFHTLAELVSVAVALGLFMLAWNARHFNPNHYITFLGIAYAFIGGLDFVHTLAYKGMPIFPGYDADLSTQLWIAARYLESGSLLAALWFLKRPLKATAALGGYSLLFTLLLFLTFTGRFPTCYREGVGLTTFKIVSEYLISGILLLTLGLLLRRRRAFDPRVLKLMSASLVLTICAELAFTFYISVYGLSNLIGHYFKLLSVYLIYKAVIETGLRKPYALMFKNLTDREASRKRAEQALQQERDNLRAVLAAMPVAILVVDAAEQVTDANPAAQRLFERSLDELQRRRCGDVLGCVKRHDAPGGCGTARDCPECDLDCAIKAVLRSGRGVYGRETEMELETSAGRSKRRWLRYSLEVVRLDGQQRVIAALHDITERKQAQAALERVRYSIDRLTDSVFWVNQDGSFIDVNDAACQNLGYTREELLTMGAPDIDPNFPREVWPAHWGQMLQCGVMTRESVHQTKHGRAFPVEVVVHNQQFGDARYNCVLARDITERKQAEEALRQREVLLMEAERLAKVGAWEWDIASETLICSEEWQNIHRVQQSQILSKDLLLIAHPDDRERIQAAWQDALAGMKPYDIEHRILRQDTGEERVVQAYGEVFLNPAGQPVKMYGAAQDITERKRAEDQIKAALKEKDVLLREIHHRVKNNLMVVTSLIEMQAEQTSDPAALALFRDLRNRVLAMTMVHEDLYQSELLSQIEFGAYLQRLVNNIRQGFAHAAAAITVAADDVFLDVQQAIPCGLIVAELVTNAFKYAFQPSPPAPEIRVEMRCDEPTYTLTVSDNGVGLPPDFDLQKVSTLGMTLVRSWARHQLRGKIDVDRQAGTKFIIVFQDKQNNPNL